MGGAVRLRRQETAGQRVDLRRQPQGLGVQVATGEQVLLGGAAVRRHLHLGRGHVQHLLFSQGLQVEGQQLQGVGEDQLGRVSVGHALGSVVVEDTG